MLMQMMYTKTMHNDDDNDDGDGDGDDDDSHVLSSHTTRPHE